MHYACKLGNLELAKFLIENCDVNQDLYNNYGDKPINFCIKKKGELAKYINQIKKVSTLGETVGRE